MKIHNSLGRSIEEFKPINPGKVTMYTCGPTVYHYVTIGNWRTYVLSDFVLRTLKYLGYQVDFVMNLTDVGHLTGDNEGDADTGEDRLEKAAKREGKNAWDIAEFYTQDFLEGFKLMNLIEPKVFSKATDHIKEQIDLVTEIEKAGFTYQINDGIYFDVEKYEKAGNNYGELSNLDQIKEGARVAVNKEKNDPRDFALWKFSPKNEKRHMEWKSPWGLGFPGWHIECSAMSMKYLGEQFDIHIGGEDLLSTHHPCEIAQAEAATNKKPFVTYWIHGAFLLIDGGKMSKSKGNAYKIQDIKEKGFDPMDLRYFYMSGHYRKKINFTWKALTAAKTARAKLVKQLAELSDETIEGEIIEQFNTSFKEAISDDFNIPKALAVVWEVLKSDEKSENKYKTIISFDSVLGLQLKASINELIAKTEGATESNYPPEVIELIEARAKAREVKDYATADKIRDRLKNEFGVEVVDGK